MSAIRIDIARAPEELRAGLAQIIAERAECFSTDITAAAVSFEQRSTKGAGGFSVSVENQKAHIQYARKVDAFRALGRLMGALNGLRDSCRIEENAKFETLGVMVDVSRNGVLRPDAAKSLLCRCALMGINVFMLYSEDTYEVPGEPFFGYLRGRYTHEEMKELDDCADALGIEMFPCIQTLGHLGQMLQWPAYAANRDTQDILLAEDEPTYQIIEKMIAAARAPFRSRRIHIGMDEAIGLGTGQYRKRHGEKKGFDILNAHLARVLDICEKHRLRPMIWSDMYFHLGSKSGDYYDKEWSIPTGVVNDIPRGVDLVYWDYYHTDPEFYAEWIDRHRSLGSDPIVAGGFWTWNHFWAGLPFALTVTDCCMRACKRKGVRQVFATMWGDDGMECDLFSALPALQYFADHGYCDEPPMERVKANFKGSCGADFDAWLKASEIDSVPEIERPQECNESVSKWLLWQDPLLGMLEPRSANYSWRGHYDALARELFDLARKNAASHRLLFPAHIAKALSLKCELRRNIVAAYLSGDKAAVRGIMEGDLRTLREAVTALWKCHREMWLNTYKPFGLEVIEARYGGILARLESLSDRLKQYLDENVPSIPELETQIETIYTQPLGKLANLHFPRIKTPSVIK